jgi:hypothetical protein
VPRELLQDRCNLVRIQDLDLLGFDLGRADDGGDVAGDGLFLNGALQDAVQDAVGVSYGARRQSAALLAAALE